MLKILANKQKLLLSKGVIKIRLECQNTGWAKKEKNSFSCN